MSRFISLMARVTVTYVAFVSGILVVLVMLAVTVEVFSRQLLGRSYPWILDFAEGSLLLITFLAAAWVLRQEAHIRVDAFVRMLSRPYQNGLDAFTSLIAGVVMLVVAVLGVNETVKDMQLNRVFGGSMLYMRWWMSIAIPVGSGLLALAFFVRSWESLCRALAKNTSIPPNGIEHRLDSGEVV